MNYVGEHLHDNAENIAKAIGWNVQDIENMQASMLAATPVKGALRAGMAIPKRLAGERAATTAATANAADAAAQTAAQNAKAAESASYLIKPQNVSPYGPIQPLPNVTSAVGPTLPRPYVVKPGAAAAESRLYKQGIADAEAIQTTAQGVAGTARTAAEQALARDLSVQNTSRRLQAGATNATRTAGAVASEAGLSALLNSQDAEAADRANRPVTETDIHRPPFANMPDKAKDILADAAKKSVPAEERRSMGFTGDDWTMLGLQMLANPSPYFLQTVGKAGVATLANIQQQKQLEAERKYHEALSGKATAESGKAAAETKFLESGSRTEKTISDEALKMLDVWKSNNFTAKTPEIIAAYQEFYKQVASNYQNNANASSPALQAKLKQYGLQ
jgi:hypothetical protein